MELENIVLSEVSQFRRPKATRFLSYVEYRTLTNISNIVKNSSHQGEITDKRGG
jgi:hypothetical protein